MAYDDSNGVLVPTPTNMDTAFTDGEFKYDKPRNDNVIDAEYKVLDDEPQSESKKEKWGRLKKFGKKSAEIGKKVGEKSAKVGKKVGSATVKAGKKVGKATVKVASATNKAMDKVVDEINKSQKQSEKPVEEPKKPTTQSRPKSEYEASMEKSWEDFYDPEDAEFLGEKRAKELAHERYNKYIGKDTTKTRTKSPSKSTSKKSTTQSRPKTQTKRQSAPKTVHTEDVDLDEYLKDWQTEEKYDPVAEKNARENVIKLRKMMDNNDLDFDPEELEYYETELKKQIILKRKIKGPVKSQPKQSRTTQTTPKKKKSVKSSGNRTTATKKKSTTPKSKTAKKKTQTASKKTVKKEYDPYNDDNDPLAWLI